MKIRKIFDEIKKKGRPKMNIADEEKEWYFVPNYSHEYFLEKYSRAPDYQDPSEVFFIINKLLERFRKFDAEIVLGIIESSSRVQIFSQIHWAGELEYLKLDYLPSAEIQMINQRKHYLRIGLRLKQRLGIITHRTHVQPFGKRYQNVPSFLSYITREYHFPTSEFLIFSKELIRLGFTEPHLKEVSSEIIRAAEKNI